MAGARLLLLAGDYVEDYEVYGIMLWAVVDRLLGVCGTDDVLEYQQPPALF
jgi:hypothetical protein